VRDETRGEGVRVDVAVGVEDVEHRAGHLRVVRPRPGSGGQAAVDGVLKPEEGLTDGVSDRGADKAGVSVFAHEWLVPHRV